MIYALIAVAVLVALGLLAFAFGRRSDVLADVERFHRAREMTTSWSTDAHRRGGSAAGGESSDGPGQPPGTAAHRAAGQHGDGAGQDREVAGQDRDGAAAGYHRPGAARDR